MGYAKFIVYLNGLSSVKRTARANLHLGVLLAFVAGALNAGGFLAIGQYTSHMTGIVSLAADNIVLGNFMLALAGFLSLIAFVSGAIATTWLISFAKRSGKQNIYIAPLMIEACLLLLFGLMGAAIQDHVYLMVSFTAVLLCFLMGLQNALITKISNAEVRTTHVTGLLTDIGIELGKLFYWNKYPRSSNQPVVMANRKKLTVHLSLVCSFFLGGLMGAMGFKYLGFVSTLPLALVIACISMAPILRNKSTLKSIPET